MPKIHIDKQDIDTGEGKNLLEAALSAGIDLPYFCWHPKMGSVGACRQCAVRVYSGEDDTTGKIVMACMTAADEGTRCSVHDAEATEMRRQVVEWLMANHPHDCPVCEEGGECHLQDMTLMTGHVYRRHRFQKRSHRNQDLGPFINHEMNRCIACYRCTRYYNDYAGGTDLGVFHAHHHVYFGRETDGTLESEFAGNLVEVCPTGVFTDKSHSARYNRKWDLQSAPSVCPHCSLGCNTAPGERYGLIKRVHNRYNDAINHYFLCDRGRYGYDFVNRDDRPRVPMIRDGETLAAVDADTALTRARAAMSGATKDKRVIGFGSPSASMEANVALRALVGPDNFYSGAGLTDDGCVTDMLAALRATRARGPLLAETEQADAVLVLGEDVTQTAPRLALAIRQAAKQAAVELADQQHIARWNAAGIANSAQGLTSPVLIAAPDATALDDIASARSVAAPADLEATAERLVAALQAHEHAESADDAFVRAALTALRGAQRPLIVAGCATGSRRLIRAAARIADALADSADPMLTLCPPEANSLGLALLEPTPTEAGLARLEAGEADTVIVLENDLHTRAPALRVDAALNRAADVIAIGHQATHGVDTASIVLPSATFAEATGSVVNHAGLAQRQFQVFQPNRVDTDDDIRAAWRWLAALAGRDDWNELDDVVAFAEAELPALARLSAAADDDYRHAGNRLARAPHRQSGRTAKDADHTVHEPELPADADAPFAFSMEGHHGQQPAALLPFVWAPRWSSNHSVFKFQDEVAGPLKGGPAGARLAGVDSSDASSRYSRNDNDLQDIPQAPPDHLLLIASPHCFGSEAQSALAPPIRERMPAPYLALNLTEAQRLGVTGGDVVTVTTEAGTATLRVMLRAQLAAGCAAVGLRLGETAGWPLPMAATIQRGEDGGG